MRLTPLLKRHGVELIVGIPEEPGNAAERLEAGGVEFVSLPLHRVRESLNPSTQLKFVASVRGEVAQLQIQMRQLEIDIVQLNGLVNPQGAIAARREGVPIVWQLLDTRTPYLVRRVLMPYVTRAADAVMSDGFEVARVHAGAEDLGERLIHFFPPVDTAWFRPDAERRRLAREELGVTEDEILLGSVSNLNPQKGHELLIAALAHLRGQGQNFKCRILGATSATHRSYAQRLHDEAESHGLLADDSLRFLDPGERVAELLPAFDVFVRTSVPRSEGTSTSILEAMSAGLPVISTDVGGIHDVVEHEVTGLLVPALEMEAVAESILRLAHDQVLRQRLSAEARRRAVTSYDVQFCAEAHLRAYEIALEHALPSRADGASID